MERSTTSCRSQKSAAASVDPSQVEHIDSFESLSFDTEDGARSLVLTTIDFDSEGAAADHLGLVVGEGSGMLELPDNIGDASAFQEANDAGIGSIVVFKKGEWVVSMHTAQGAGIDLPPHEIAERLIVSRATVTGLVDSLESRGLAQRGPHPTDRRMLLVEITEKGRKAADEFRPIVHRHHRAWFEVLDDGEKAQLTRLLERVRDRLRSAGS